MPILEKDDNKLNYFGHHDDKKSRLKEKYIERNHSDWYKGPDMRNSRKNNLPWRIPQDVLFECNLSLSLKAVRFNEQIFPTDKHISDIKYHHLIIQNNHHFYPFND